MGKLLSPIQEDIVNTPGNIIVRASAGAGKTHTMVTKIESDIEKNQSHKVIAAITFTIKAAGEIRDRLTTADAQFVGTNNSFAIEEIIKPFMKDVYGPDYDKDLSTDYKCLFNTFEDGVDVVREQSILGSIRDNKQNFIFQLALSILKNSYACREYLKAKYFKIYVDEYQDCDRDMHDFFMYICDELKIDTFVVGDEKQSIYMWRGAYPEAFKSIWSKQNFSKKFMRENFRSCAAIQNYSNLLCEDTRQFFRTDADISDIKLLVTTNETWNQSVLRELDESKSVAVLRYTHDNARKAAEVLSSEERPFIYIPQPPIAEITTNVAWLYNAIANYYIVKTYSVYDVLQIVPEEAVGNKKIKRELENALIKIEETGKNKDVNEFNRLVKELALFFGYETKDADISKLFETICDEKYHNFYNQDEILNKSITFHSSKGLEFDQVVIFAEDYRLSDMQSIYNHYVASTRAKSKLVIVYIEGYNAKQFYKNLNLIISAAGKKVEDIITIKYNCT